MNQTMERPYEAFYRRQRITVYAVSSHQAQLRAAKKFNARKTYEVTVVLADEPISTGML